MTLKELETAIEQSLPTCEIGDVRTFYRAGELPACGYSQNYREGTAEAGVSVYWFPFANSFAGLTGRDWFSGKGRLIGFGSDGEPIVEPIGKWKKFFSVVKDVEDGNPAHKFARVKGLIDG